MRTDFDKTTFADLLKRSVGSRTQKEFAALTGISSAHLSRLLHQKFDSPPSIDTLQRLAAHAQNGVTYWDLLNACGYMDVKKEGYPWIAPSADAQSHPQDRYLAATILTALQTLPIPWVQEPVENRRYHLAIALQNPLPSHWYFQFLDDAAAQMPRFLSAQYAALLFQPLRPEDKYSFVTCHKEVYTLYRIHRPTNLNVNLSIVWADIEQLQVQAEDWITLCDPKIPSVSEIHF